MKLCYRLLFYNLLLIMLFTFSGCSRSAETNTTENEEITQSISTEYSFDTEFFIEDSEIEELESTEILNQTEEQASETDTEISNSENNNSESAQTQNNNEEVGSNNSNTDSTDKNNGSENESQSSDEVSGSGNNDVLDNTYHPADVNKDGWVSADEEMGYITPEKQACIDAGYGFVVEMDGGEWYAVLMKNDDHTIDGKNGRGILREYLNARGLDGHIGGCWINPDYEWYWFTAKDIYEPITEEDEEFWN